MDVRMPQMDGIEATRQICGTPELAGSKVLILTTFDLDEYVYAALRAGASGFLLKDVPPADLLTAIRVVAGVTDREREVLTLVARGLSNVDIAERLQLSLATVKTHIGRLLAKLAARDRAQLVIVAYESGLVRVSGTGGS
jgi:DNA-binding NarL/FixJ family response regulator